MSAIYEAMAGVMSEVDYIGKDKHNQSQNFKYRGIDDVYNALHPILAKHGIFTTPEVVAQEREERVNAKGTVLAFSRVTMRYTFWAKDGSSVACSTIGEGMDSGDKATNKAMAIAHKYALFQTFCIPTEDMPDPDAEAHKLAPREEARGQRPSFHEYDLSAVRASFEACQTMDDVKREWMALAVKSGHPQLAALTAMKDAAKGRIEFVGDGSSGQPDNNQPLTEPQRKALQAHYSGVPRESRLAAVSVIVGRQIGSFNELSKADAHNVLEAIKQEAR